MELVLYITGCYSAEAELMTRLSRVRIPARRIGVNPASRGIWVAINLYRYSWPKESSTAGGLDLLTADIYLVLVEAAIVLTDQLKRAGSYHACCPPM